MGGPRVQNAHWSTNEHLPRMVAIALVCILAFLVAGFAFRACTQEEVEEPLTPQPFYNHALFIRNGQFYEYIDGDLIANKTGVDVSDHQEWIDWEAVRASGVKFAYIRIGYRGSTEGELYADAYYEYNLQATKDAGVERGVYFFSQAITADEAREEADFVLQLLNKTKLEYPVAFDSEMAAEGIQSRVAGLTQEESTAIAQAFCDAIKAGGYDVILYGNGHDLGRYSSDLLERYPVWYAEYGALPAYTQKYVLWQYASQGQINGIGSPVDLNLDLGPALEARESSTS